MNVLGSIRLSTLICMGALQTLATIVICYSLAVSLGHVQPWLPMISDCAVYSPEKYPFRFGLALSSILIGAQVVLVHQAKGYSKASAFFGLLASLGLGIVSVVNEEENSKVHGVSAVVFYFSYWIYMALITCFSPVVRLMRQWYQQRTRAQPVDYTQLKYTVTMDTVQQKGSSRQSLVQLVKVEYTWRLALMQLLTTLCGIDLIVFAILSVHWGKNKLYIAICEWFGTLCILFYNWCFGISLSNNYQLAEIITVDN